MRMTGGRSAIACLRSSRGIRRPARPPNVALRSKLRFDRLTCASEIPMQRSYDIHRYDFGCYDKHLCLKPPLLLIAAIALLCRDFLLPLLVAVASIKGGSSSLEWLISGGRQPLWFVAAAPALMVLYALIRRAPTGDMFARWTWRNGRLLLAAAALMQCYPHLQTLRNSAFRIHHDEVSAVFWLLVNGLVLAYVLLAGRVRHSFADFPSG